MLDMRGNADEAAQMSVDGLAAREPFEDTFTFLEYVRAHWKVGVLTNADDGSVIPLLQRYNLSFDALVTSQMAGAYKPDPRIFLRVLEETGVSATGNPLCGGHAAGRHTRRESCGDANGVDQS